MPRQKTTSSVKFWALLLLFGLGSSYALHAQSLDKIDAIVGEDIILHSEIMAQIQYYKANGMEDDGTMYCRVMEEKIFEKLLLNKARQDSIDITDLQVDGEVDRKIAYFRQIYGDELEKIYGKPEIEIKADIRKDVKNQLLVQQMREQIIGQVAITPREVQKFYNGLNKDSLPPLPAEAELYHIVAMPKPSLKSKDMARARLERLRDQIVKGEVNFEDAARNNSMDYGSAKVGGDLGTFGRGRMVPEFEEVAFKAEIGEVSPIFESPYGFHIMKVYKQTGIEVGARHILIAPLVDSDDEERAKESLKDYKERVENGSASFQKLAMEESDDQMTAPYGGSIKNPQTGEQRIPIDMLDANLFFLVDNLKEGEISEPEEWFSPANKRGYHIVYMKRRYEPHVFTMETDFYKIQQAALQNKQAGALEKWFKRAVNNIYIDIKNEDCIGVLPYLLPYSSK